MAQTAFSKAILKTDKWSEPELISDQNPGPIAPPRSKRGGSKGIVRRRATAKRVMEKGRYVRVIEGKKIRVDFES